MIDLRYLAAMDKLDEWIQNQSVKCAAVRAEAESRRAQFDEAKRKHEEALASLRDAELELRTLEKAAALRPAVVPVREVAGDVGDPLDSSGVEMLGDGSYSGSDGAVVKRGGRQPGSITYKWRTALADFVSAGNHPVSQETFYLVTRARLGLAETSVRERTRNYVAQGIMIEIDGKICVAQSTIEKFHLRDLAAQTNTAPTAEAVEAVNGSGDGGAKRVPDSAISCDPQADRH